MADTDITAQLISDANILLSGAAVASLPSGTTTYTGVLTGSGTIALTSGADGGSTLIIGSQTFVLPDSNETETLTLADGVWSTDISAAIAANQAVTLTTPATLELRSGGTTYTGALGGSGKITVTAPSNSTAALAIGGYTIYLSAGESQVLTVSNGALSSVDVTAALLADQAITLSVPTTAALPVGVTQFTGSLTGGAPLTLTSGAGAATLTLANGTTFILPSANESETFTFANNAWTANATSAFLAGQAIVLNQPTTIDLPNGASAYAGALTGSAPLTLASGSAGATTQIDGQTFILPDANETQTLSLVNGVLTADISAAVNANQDVTLTGPTTMVLHGNVTYTGTLGGSGTILITTPANSGGSLTFSGLNETVYLGAGYSETATVVNGLITSVDVTPELLANQEIVLNFPATVKLPAGVTTYTGKLDENGTLQVTSAATGGSTLIIGAQTFVLPSANETETFTLTNGAWSADVTAALLANKNIVLTTNATANLPAGTTTYTGTISGAGTLSVTAGSGGASTLNLGPTSYSVAAAQTERQTLSGGQWAADITAQIVANQNVVLNGSAAVFLTGNDTYTGTISGSGQLVITSPANGGATLTLKGGPSFSIPVGGQTEAYTLANGVWTQDVTSLILANQSINITVPSTLELPAGVTRYTGSIYGVSSSLTITSPASGGSTLELAGGRTFILPAGGESETLTLVNGQWVSNVSSALAGNQAITLAGPATATLAAGTTTYTGALTGAGRLTLTAPASGASTVTFNGASVTVAAGQSTTITLVNGAVATDVGAALAANQVIALSGPAAALLVAGTTTYTGTVSGAGTLTLTSANSGSGSTLVIGGQSFTLPAANETQTLTLANGVWTTDLSEAAENNQAIALTGAATVNLLAGTETESAAITGAGAIALTAAAVAGGSTFVVGGHTFVLGAAGETETATLSGGVWTTDVTSSLLANQPITLSGANTAELPAGVTIYTGAITGAGTLKITSSAAGASTLVIGGLTFALPSANEAETLNLSASGAWSVDVSSALAANQAIVLSATPTTATLAAGTTTYTGALSGAGTLTITSSATGASTLVIGGQTFILPSANETETLTRSASNTWSVDITAAALANQNVTLTGVPATLSMPYTVNYSGVLSGTGTITVSNVSTGGAAFNIGSANVYLPSPNETYIVTVQNGAFASMDVSAALLANKGIYISNVNATATLPAGTTTYTGYLTVVSGSSLTLNSGAAGGATLTLTNGVTFVLSDANESETFTYTNGSWTANATAAAAAGQDIVLNQPTTIDLGAGTTRVGTITGSAPLTLVSGPNGGALRLADGTLFTLPGANETETVSLVNGTWTTNIGAALQANLPITLSGANVATLGAGTTTYNAAISGAGTLKLTSANVSGGSTLVIGSQTFSLPDANESELLTLSNGVWRIDVTSAIDNRQDIVLNGAETVELNAGGTYTGASITGSGSLLVTSSASGESSLQLGNALVVIPDAGETVTLTQTPTGWVENLTAAFLANKDIYLSTSMPTSLALPSGTTTYTGKITGSGKLTVAASASGGTLVIGAQTFVLNGGETVSLSLSNGVLVADVSAALLANAAITLNGGPTTATLAAGVTNYTGVISGAGSLVLTSSSTGGSTLTLAGGTSFVLPAANETATAVLSNGKWSLNVTSNFVADQPITLSGASVATLPTGSAFTYTGTISGTGTLTLTRPDYGVKTVVIGSQTLTINDNLESETLNFVNGVWVSTDITAAVAADNDLVLNGASTLELAPGAGAYTGNLTGSGTLTVTTGASGGGSLTLADGAGFSLPDANETETATLSNGVWTTNVSAAIAAGDDIAVDGDTVATLAAGTTTIASLTGSGTLTLTASSSGPSTLVTASGVQIAVLSAGESIVVSMTNGVPSLDVSGLIEANSNIVLSTDATAFLAAGPSSYTGSITGSGTLTLFGSTTGASTITLGGTAYTIAASSALSLQDTNGTFTPTATTDISAAIKANQASIVFTGGKYVIDVPAGETFDYTGVMSGYGTLEVTGGGTLMLEQNNTFAPPAGSESFPTVASDYNFSAPGYYVYEGYKTGGFVGAIQAISNPNPPSLFIDPGVTLQLGGGGAYGGFTTPFINVVDDGTLYVPLTSNGTIGSSYPTLISGTGNVIGGVALVGDQTFSGVYVNDVQVYLGTDRVQLFLPNAKAIFSNGSILANTPFTTTSQFTQNVYENAWGGDINIDSSGGRVVWSGVYTYTDSPPSDLYANPTLSNPALNYTIINGNNTGRGVNIEGGVAQFGDGTTTNFFLPGNPFNTYINLHSNGLFILDYADTGPTYMNTTVAGGGITFASFNKGNNANAAGLGTVIFHQGDIVVTQQQYYNGTTQIDSGATLQLGDGTHGDMTKPASDAANSYSNLYETSGGDGDLLQAGQTVTVGTVQGFNQGTDTSTGYSNTTINGVTYTDNTINNGILVIDNVGATEFTNLSGSGQLQQSGAGTTTLLANTTYTGATTVTGGTLAIGAGGSIASSAGVALLGAASAITAAPQDPSSAVVAPRAAVFDISQAGAQAIQNLSGAAGSTVALGSGALTVETTGTSVFDGSLVDGGLGGGVGGALIETGGGLLELGGNSTYTGDTQVEAGTLQLDGVSLATSQVQIAAGAQLAGSGTIQGGVVDDGTVEAEGGELSLGAVTGTGALTIGASATLALAGASSQTINFDGGGVLDLGDASSFSGAITGFARGDSIDLLGVAATSLSVSTTGVVSVLDGTTSVAQLQMGAPAAGLAYSLASDGAGGSILTETPASVPTAPTGLTLEMAEDAYEGNAEFTVSVNGVAQGGVYTVTALHDQGQSEAFNIPGNFGTGLLDVAISFINDAYGGSPSLDRNLYVDSINDGGAAFNESAVLYGNGTQNFAVDNSTTYTIGASDKLALFLSEDAYDGDAQFTVSVDGVQIGGPQSVTTLHSSGQSEEFDFTGNFGAGPHTIAVDFLNDKYDGSPSEDRNLYVNSITYDGQNVVENSAQDSQGSKNYTGFGSGIDNIAAANTTLTSTGADTINAGSGTDTINLTGPSATLNGGTGIDTVLAEGSDTIIANGATMTVTGGAGSLNFTGGSALATVTAGSGATTATAGAGGLDFTVGTGSATITEGPGAGLISLINGAAGGATLINAFTRGLDEVTLTGYSSTAVNQALEQATVVGGSTTVVLPDHSTIIFAGVANINQSSFHII